MMAPLEALRAQAEQVQLAVPADWAVFAENISQQDFGLLLFYFRRRIDRCPYYFLPELIINSKLSGLTSNLSVFFN